MSLYRRLHDDARFTDVVPGEPPFRSDLKPKKKRKEGAGPPIFFVDFFARFAPENAFVWGELKVEQRKEGKSKSRTLSKPGWARLVTEDAARLLQLRLDQTAAHWRAATEYWHTRCMPGLAERLAAHEHRFFCAYLEVDCAEAESIAKRPAQYEKPVMSPMPAHLQKIAGDIQRRTAALDVEPASMLTLLEWRASPDKLLGV